MFFVVSIWTYRTCKHIRSNIWVTEPHSKKISNQFGQKNVMLIIPDYQTIRWFWRNGFDFTAQNGILGLVLIKNNKSIEVRVVRGWNNAAQIRSVYSSQLGYLTSYDFQRYSTQLGTVIMLWLLLVVAWMNVMLCCDIRLMGIRRWILWYLISV